MNSPFVFDLVAADIQWEEFSPKSIGCENWPETVEDLLCKKQLHGAGYTHGDSSACPLLLWKWLGLASAWSEAVHLGVLALRSPGRCLLCTAWGHQHHLQSCQQMAAIWRCPGEAKLKVKAGCHKCQAWSHLARCMGNTRPDAL